MRVLRDYVAQLARIVHALSYYINKRIKEGYLKYLLKRRKMTDVYCKVAISFPNGKWSAIINNRYRKLPFLHEPQCLQMGYIT
jgi:hypothetical protein